MNSVLFWSIRDILESHCLIFSLKEVPVTDASYKAFVIVLRHKLKTITVDNFFFLDKDFSQFDIQSSFLKEKNSKYFLKCSGRQLSLSFVGLSSYTFCISRSVCVSVWVSFDHQKVLVSLFGTEDKQRNVSCPKMLL